MSSAQIGNQAACSPEASGQQQCFACLSSRLNRISAVRDVHAGTGRTYDLLRCGSCDSVRIEQIPTTDEFRLLYPDDYYSYSESRGRLAVLKDLLALTYRRHRYVPSFKTLLEIGPGRGAFLKRLSSLGTVAGLERSPAARAAAKKIGIDVVVGKVEDASTFRPESFDVVYSNHAFEHLPDPNAALASMRAWLKPGGELFIGVPNIAGLVPRVFGRNWYYLGPPLHITNSTPRGLSSLLGRHGFEVERVVYNSDPFSIAMSLYLSAGGRVNEVPLPFKVVLGIIAVAAFPLSRLLDYLGAGDCIEIHARAI